MRNIKLVKQIRYAGLEMAIPTDKGRSPIIPVYLCDSDYVPGAAKSKRVITTINFSADEITQFGHLFDYSDYIIVVGKKFTKFSKRTQSYLIYREYLNLVSIDLSYYDIPILSGTDLEMVSEDDMALIKDAVALAKFGGLRKMLAEYTSNKMRNKSIKGSAKFIKQKVKKPEDSFDGFFADGIPLKTFEQNIQLTDADKENVIAIADSISDMIDAGKDKKEIIKYAMNSIKHNNELTLSKVIAVITTTTVIPNETKAKIISYFEGVADGFSLKTIFSLL